jgi:MEDS: MEthanogen/methylotroph, DcmR Sensory domain
MAYDQQPIHFANSTLGSERHICALFHSPEEEYRVLLPFIREGFERGEKAFHIVDPALVDDHVHRMRDAGIDT